MRTGDAEFRLAAIRRARSTKCAVGLGRADLARGGLEQRQPAVEMIGIDGQRHVLDHRRAVIAPDISATDDQKAHICCRCGSQSLIRASKTGASTASVRTLA